MGRPDPVGRGVAAGPVGRRADALLYGLSAVFAGITAVAMGIPLYREWGRLAVGPYVVGTVWMVVVARRRARAARRAGGSVNGRSWQAARLAAFLIVLLGATVVPLALEVTWAAEGNAALHVQPEVLVVERAGARAAHGRDPYQVIDRNGHILIRQSAVPVYELYYPYLPGMVVFGFSSGSRVEARLTDARIQFLVFTVVVAAVAPSPAATAHRRPRIGPSSPSPPSPPRRCPWPRAATTCRSSR